MSNNLLRTVAPAPLSARTAFIVHLTGSATGAVEALTGRVEHVTSGRSMRFTSLHQLAEFMESTVWSDSRPGNDTSAKRREGCETK